MKSKSLYFIKELINRLRTDDITAWAAQLTFYLILSIFPFTIFVIEIMDRIDVINFNAIYELTRFFPEEIVNIFRLLIEDIIQSESPKSTIVITLFATLFSASKGIQAIIKSLNFAYKKKETRSFIYLKAISLIYTLLFAIILVIVMSLIVYGNKLLAFLIKYTILSDIPYSTFDIVRYLLSIVLTFLFFSLLYNATPNRKISLRDELPGSLFATLFFILLSFLFSIYINNSKNISYVYGSLTSIIILMLWLYFTSIIIMIGGEINGILGVHLDAMKEKKDSITP